MAVVVVSGANKGIGWAVVQQLLADPSAQHTILAVARHVAPLQQLARHYPQQVLPICLDLAQPHANLGALGSAASSYGGVDVLLNNAGVLVKKPFEQLNYADWQHSFEVNVGGAVRLIQYLLPYCNKPAHIVNIGSMGGVQGTSKFAGMAAYGATKAALANLTEVLSVELADRRIAVNCLALGAVATDMLQTAFEGYEGGANVTQTAQFIAHFALNGHHLFNGKILPVSYSTP